MNMRASKAANYTSTCYTQTLADHGVLASVGSVGDAYDNALAESFVDSFKTELIADRVWRSRSQLELATVEWVGWFNQERLHESLGDLPPAEFEALHAAREALDGSIPGDGSVAALTSRAAERLSGRRIASVEVAGGRNGAEPSRPPAQIAAAASLRSPYGLAALGGGADPTTLP
jgi:putative transposase